MEVLVGNLSKNNSAFFFFRRVFLDILYRSDYLSLKEGYKEEITGIVLPYLFSLY